MEELATYLRQYIKLGVVKSSRMRMQFLTLEKLQAIAINKEQFN